MSTYRFSVLCTLDAYGSAEVEADSFEEALAKAIEKADEVEVEPEWITADPNRIYRIENEEGRIRYVEDDELCDE